MPSLYAAVIREFVFRTIRDVRKIFCRKYKLTPNNTGTTASTASANLQLNTNIATPMPAISVVPQMKSITPHAKMFDSR
jgi:hypothetical protein